MEAGEQFAMITLKAVWASLKYVVLVIFLAVLALLIIDFNSRMVEWRRLTAERDKIAAQVTDLAVTRAALETKVAWATSPAAVYEWAYENGRWVRQGEYLVVPIAGSEATPAPAPTAAVMSKPVENWELWLSLFTDEELP